jgi:uncharacterized damage-inducible protein DinB
MKKYFLKLLGYNQFANEQIIQAVQIGGALPVTLKLMGHLLAVELAWLERCKLIPPSMENAWPENTTIQQCRQQISERHDDWVAFLNSIDEHDLDKIIPYHSFTGHAFENQLSDIITQVLNHGTHTRAQIGQQLKMAGAQTLPITDYSYYLRLLKS